MKTILFDSLDEAGARKLTGCKVIDESGEPVGTVEGLWMDSSSHRVEFVGVKNSSFSDSARRPGQGRPDHRRGMFAKASLSCCAD
jgi:sporulation protein YlmC with PRC-barrel domain